MSFLTKLFGKLKRKKAKVQPDKVVKKKSASSGTVLRQPEKDTPLTKKKRGPMLTALEIAEQKGWEVKTLPVWQPGDVILDTYEVEDVISGGMGHVYIANHKRWKRKLAIKSPNEMMLSQKEHFARILREANAWVEMGMHPNVAYCYYVRNIEDVPHIVVEYVDGGDLKEWIEEGKCIDYRVNIDLAIQFCHGMEFAHAKGMIHRDIKPANILMTKDGVLKITDFGLVREQEAGVGDKVSAIRREEEGRKSENGSLTTIGTQMGTEGYMSPEQYANPHDVDERTDIFAFGVCLYEMFCGNRPYEITLGSKQEAPDPIALSGDGKFPLELTEVLKRSVQWDISDRYRSFEEIRQELSQIHKKLYKEDSPYAKLELVDLEADGLNNLGVSYFELGRKEDSISCWEKALEINQTHLESTYNLSLIKWRDGEIADDEVLKRLDNCVNNPTVDKESLFELISSVHAERFDLDAAKDILQDIPGRYEVLFSDQKIDHIKSIRTIKKHTGPVTSVAVSGDGRIAVSGSDDTCIRLWDLVTGQCVHIMQGHTSTVESVAITADDRFAVSGSEDKTLRLWDLETGQCVRIMEGHTTKVNSIAVIDDGILALSGSGALIESAENNLKLWDLETGQCVRTMRGHRHAVLSVATFHYGRFCISGSLDHALKLWDLETGKCVRTMEGHNKAVTSVAVTSDGRFALSGSNDKTIKLWDLGNCRCIRTLKGHAYGVTSVAVTGDGRFALSGSNDETIKLWNLETGRCIRTLQGHTDSVSSVVVFADSSFVLSGSRDKNIKQWHITLNKTYRASFRLSQPKSFEARKKEEQKLSMAISQAEVLIEKGHYKGAYTILYEAWKSSGFSHEHSILKIYSNLMKKGRIKNLLFYDHLKTFEGHTAIVWSVAITGDGRFALSGSMDKTLKLWNIETDQCIRTLEGHAYEVTSVAMTGDGRFALSGSNDETIKLWNLETGRCIRTLKGILKGHSGSVTSVAMTGDGRFALSGSEDTNLKLWRIRSGRCIRTMEGHTDTIESVAVTADGTLAVSGSADNTIRFWDLETSRCIRTIQGHSSTVNSVAITGDNRFAVSGSKDKTLKLWDVETGQCVRTMEGHKSNVNSVAVINDGRLALSGSMDETIRLWDLETGRCIRTMEGHTDTIESVAITGDGMLVVSGSADNTIKLWRFIWDLEL